MTLKLTGSGISPFVKKVRVFCAEKGLDYEHDPGRVEGWRGGP